MQLMQKTNHARTCLLDNRLLKKNKQKNPCPLMPFVALILDHQHMGFIYFQFVFKMSNKRYRENEQDLGNEIVDSK